jgi:tetratricopeptide (TPR) repeat protein
MLGRFAEARADFDREIAIFQSIGDLEGLADAYNGMGDLGIRQKRYPEAIRMCGKGPANRP